MVVMSIQIKTECRPRQTAPPMGRARRTSNFVGAPVASLVYRNPGALGHKPRIEATVSNVVKIENWEDLLSAVARHSDRSAFEKLFVHFGPRIKAYLMKLGSDAGQAEDLMQDVMAQVWRKSALFDRSKAGASTWIFTIARNLRIDSFRRDRRPQIDEKDPALVPEAEKPADEMLHSQEVSVRLRGILESLPDDQKQVVILSFYDDKPHSTIAEELGLPLGTVKSRLRLAMGKIKAVWGESAGVKL